MRKLWHIGFEGNMFKNTVTRYMYVYVIPVGYFISSTVSMTFQSIFCLPYRTHKQTGSELFQYRCLIATRFVSGCAGYFSHSAVLFVQALLYPTRVQRFVSFQDAIVLARNNGKSHPASLENYRHS